MGPPWRGPEDELVLPDAYKRQLVMAEGRPLRYSSRPKADLVYGD